MTPSDPDKPEEIEELFDKGIEERLAPEERERLEQLVIADETVRRRYVAYLQVHAALAFESAALPRLLGEAPANEPEIFANPAPARSPRPRALQARFALGGYAAAAAIAAGFAWLWFQQATRGPAAAEPVATLVEAEGCRWAGSELPTFEGATLPAGTLNLVEGIATLRFDSGAVVSLEAPVSVNVVSSMKCRLISGSVLAEVPEAAHGFTIETADMEVIDHGTRFGVTTSELGQSQVFVFEGLVEIDAETPAAAAEPRMLKEGQSIQIRTGDAAPEQEPSRGHDAVQALSGDGWTVIPTSLGSGKDTFVRHDGKGRPQGKEPLVMVKHTELAVGNQRKGYFGFDLATLPEGTQIEEAQFTLEVETSGLGFVALVPDSKFAVYGLNDGNEDRWDERSLVWETAPANTPESNTLDPDKVTRLGSFEIRRGAAADSRTISGEALADFLNADTNGLATIIVVRETGESEVQGLVHAFASREHPTAMPPALRVRTH